MSRTHLYHFLGGYFHQDWSLDALSWEEVVAKFRNDEGVAGCGAVSAELQALLAAELSDEALSTIVYREIGCSFDPRPDLGGPTLREWLQQLDAELRAA